MAVEVGLVSAVAYPELIIEPSLFSNINVLWLIHCIWNIHFFKIIVAIIMPCEGTGATVGMGG